MELDEEELKATQEMKAINKIVAGDEKTADEMFEELGFKKIVDNKTELKYEYRETLMEDNLIHTFLFAKVGKIIYSYRDTLYCHRSMGFSFKELQAINKKCEELGWI